MGSPDPDSPVSVTANYTLSFDALRSALEGNDGYILALDTQGITDIELLVSDRLEVLLGAGRQITFENRGLPGGGRWRRKNA